MVAQPPPGGVIPRLQVSHWYGWTQDQSDHQPESSSADNEQHMAYFCVDMLLPPTGQEVDIACIAPDAVDGKPVNDLRNYLAVDTAATTSATGDTKDATDIVPVTGRVLGSFAKGQGLAITATCTKTFWIKTDQGNWHSVRVKGCLVVPGLMIELLAVSKMVHTGKASIQVNKWEWQQPQDKWGWKDNWPASSCSHVRMNDGEQKVYLPIKFINNVTCLKLGNGREQ